MYPLEIPSMNHGLGETVELLRETVKIFAGEEIAQHASMIDAGDTIPADFWPKLGDLGVLGVTADEEWGGAGMGFLELCVIVEELSRASAAIGVAYAAHTAGCVDRLNRFAARELKERLLPALISGETVATSVFEVRPIVTAEEGMPVRLGLPVGNAPRASGRFAGVNASAADVFLLLSAIERPAGGVEAGAVLIEPPAAGFEVGERLAASAIPAADLREIVLNDVAVDRGMLVLAADTAGGMDFLNSSLDLQRLTAAAGLVGLMQAGLDGVVPGVHERRRAGAPLAADPLVELRVGQMYAATQATRSHLYAVCRALDRGDATRKDIVGVRLFAAEQAPLLLLSAIACIGGDIWDGVFSRLLRNAAFFAAESGGDDARRRLIGRDILDQTW